MNETIMSSKLVIGLFLAGLVAIYLIPFNEKSDMEIMAEVQKKREKLRGVENYSKQTNDIVEAGQQYRGVFYGYLPCDDCAGVKMTLSLKNKQNYLLVTQYARASNKEYYEKGAYEWDEAKKIVTLISRKKNKKQQYYIEDEGTLIQLNADGHKHQGAQDKYTLSRTDKKKSRTLHIH
jgi:uncharacterized lipoprotein NlpE involved in copper resistance